MSATIDTWTGRLGLAAGVCVVAAWLLIAGTPAAAPEPSASIRLGTLGSGELDVSPTGSPVLTASDLRPGHGAEEGTVRVRNQTPRPLDVGVRTSAVQRDLDASTRIEVTDGRRALLRGPLGQSRRWSQRTVRLLPDETRTLTARVWIPRGARDGWQAAHGDVTLQLRGVVVRPR